MIDEKNEKLQALQEKIRELSEKEDELREARTELLRKRFDLKDQRGYYRNQLREAKENGEAERITYLNQRLNALQKEIDETDARVLELETEIEEGAGRIEELHDELADLKKQIGHENQGGASDPETEDALKALGRMFEKTVNYVADTFQNLNLDQVSQAVADTAEKAARAAADAAAELEHGFQGRKENSGQNSDSDGNCIVCGAAVIDGGSYRNLTISGACRSTSTVTCECLRAGGSFRVQGDLQCSETLHTGGSLQCENLNAGVFSCTGIPKVSGDLNADEIRVPGSLHIGGSMKAGNAEVSGMLKVSGDCEADNLKVTGAIQADGSVSADQITVRQAYPESRAGRIQGSRITITQAPVNGLLSGILKNQTNFSCDRIDGEEIILQGVTADTVRGARITVKDNCKIRHLEYTQSCSVDSSSSVMTCTKI